MQTERREPVSPLDHIPIAAITPHTLEEKRSGVDLRPYITNRKQLEEGIHLLRDGLLLYQPFILADDVEVGDGQNHHDRYEGATSIYDFNVYAPAYTLTRGVGPQSLEHFRKCNAEYRQLYAHVAEEICRRLDEPVSNYTIAEIGCNSGLNLFNLALRGAKCHGYDWNNMTPVFRWLNTLLGTDVQFTEGVYDNLTHRFQGAEVAEADIMVNTIFTNHQCDPLQFLCYLCDRAKQGVFLWALVHTEHADAAILFPEKPPHAILANSEPFPLSLNNAIVMTEKLLRTSFQSLGFEVEELPQYCPSAGWHQFTAGFRMFYATRTRNVRSAYWKQGT